MSNSGLGLGMFSLAGKTAVVMGGTSGIGQALALGLAEAGADVIAASRREQAVEATANQIEARGRKTLRITADVTGRSSLERLRDAVLTQFGKVDVLDFVSCHDVGKAINRNSVLGQFYGGVAMGIGYGLLEEFDYEDAVPKQLNFDEYLIATAMDVPKINGIIVENELAAPAIVNAIYNATGKRVREIPATLERVLLGHKLTRKGERGSVRKDVMAGDSCKLGRGDR